MLCLATQSRCLVLTYDFIPIPKGNDPRAPTGAQRRSRLQISIMWKIATAERSPFDISVFLKFSFAHLVLRIQVGSTI